MRLFGLNLLATIGYLSGKNLGVSGEDCTKVSNPLLKESVGNGDFPYNVATVSITARNTDEVTFNVMQFWDQDGIPLVAVHYPTLEGNDQCTKETMKDGLIPYSEPFEFTAKCIDGYAEVSVYAYVGLQDDFDVAECESCAAPDDKYVGYYLDIPCLPECLVEDPHTTSDCVELAKPVWEETTGNSAFSYLEGMVSILEQSIDEVLFSVAQLWNEAGVPMFAVNFRSEDSVNVCEMETDEDGGIMAYNSSKTYTSQCLMGYAEVTLYAFVGPASTFEVEECKACSVPDDNYVAYLLSLPCTPTCEEAIPKCLDEPLVVLSDVGHDESCMYTETPIMTETTGMKTDSVEFVITNTWTEDIDALSVQFINDKGELTCDSFTYPAGFKLTSQIVASCTDGFAEVSVTILSSKIDHVSQIIPDSCDYDGGVGSCSYEFVIPCLQDVDCDTTPSSSSPSASPSSGPSVSPSGSPSDAPSGGPSSSPSGSPSGSPTPYPTVSMEPTDCYMHTPPEVVTSKCFGTEGTPMDFSVDSIVMTGQYDETVAFSISQDLFKEAALSISYDNIDLVSTCHLDAKALMGSSSEYEAHCVNGMTSVTLIISTDNDFTDSECNACDAEDLKAHNISFCAYSIEVSCQPKSVECGEPSAAPSGSFYPSSAPSESPTKSASPSFSPSGSPTSSPSDKPSAVPTASPSEKPSASPSDVPSSSPSASPSGSPSSSPSDSPSASPSGGPSLSPSDAPSVGPSTSPSASPSDSPSSSPSDAPSGGPSSSPSASPSSGPSVSPSGSPSDAPSGGPSSSPSVSPTESPSGSPSFTPSGNPSESPSDAPSISPSESPSGSFYPSTAPSDSPTMSSSPSASPSDSPSASPSSAPSGSPSHSPSSGPSASPSASPSDFPSVSPSSSPSSNPSTSPSDAPSSSPSASPSSAPSAAPTRCPRTQPILIDTIGSASYPENAPPIQIIFQNTTHVSFKVINEWDTLFTNVFTQYHEGGFGETECLEEVNVKAHTVVDEYTAVCMHHVPISIVNVWVADGNNQIFSSIDDAEIPECCHPPEFSDVPIVQYTFKLNCTDPCPPDEVEQRRLSEKKNMEPKINQAPVAVPATTAGKPDTDGKDNHFCVSEDYPCGEDGTHVNVCHYSARDGYKTFCVPEADSDVLAFYKKDYCGPCIRGFGETSRK